MLPRTRVSWFSAFTLIELLVVIGVIAILAGFLLPTLIGVKTRAKAKIAKSEMANLAAAIAQYESEYSRVPVSKPVIAQALAQPVKDFTYGGELQDGTAVGSYSSISYKATNDQLIAILQAENLAVNPALQSLSQTYNPRKITFFTGKRVTTTDIGGIGPDGVFRDPWGTPYFVTVDVDGDEKVLDGFYGRMPMPNNSLRTNIAPVVVWSAGPDLKANSSIGPKDGANKDNVVSWD